MPVAGRAFAVRYESWVFVGLAIVITWCGAAPGVLGSLGFWELSEDELTASHLMGALGPTVAAFLAVLWGHGRRGVAVWASRMDPGRVPVGWAMVAFGVPLAFAGFGLAAAAFVGETGFEALEALARDETFWRLNLVLALAYGVLEEPGWRGFLLPRLIARHGVASATLMTTGAWLAWHTPILIYREQVGGPFDAFMFGVSLLAGAWMLTWLFLRSGGAVWACIIFHVVFDLCVLTLIAVSPVALAAMNAALIVAAAILASSDMPSTRVMRLTQAQKPAH